MEKNNKNMLMIIGGASINGSIINAFSSLFKTIYGIGQGVGGALRRIASRKLCKV